AMRAYLGETALPVPALAAVGIATPVTGDRVQMTNHHWSFSIEALRQALGFERLRVINDFTALALALPHLPAHELRQVGGGAAQPGAAIGLVGAGTGLGVSGLLPLGPRWLPLAGEGGHVSLPAETPLEAELVAVLRQRYGRVSAERALSGPGLRALHQALGVVQGQSVTPADAPEAAAIVEAALAGGDAHCAQVLDLFCGWLGAVAGDLALTLGARGGVYIGGGIVPRLGMAFDRSPFRARFEAKGRFASYLREIPVQLILSPTSPALRGAAEALEMPDGA
uniref:glucokinase n=1 Tax=Ideonella sp. B508-1 TaxID=137716 RepID=UPI000475429C